MRSLESVLQGVRIFEPAAYSDKRGVFMEIWNAREYSEADVPIQFVQDNLSRSKKHVLRGLHYQHPHGQGKLVSVLQGEVYDVVVDIRRGSERFGQWMGMRLSAENRRQLYIPEGYAHGFVVLSEVALFYYKCTEYYRPDTEHVLRWDDPEIGIDWPVQEPILSEKDRDAPSLASVEQVVLPTTETGA